MATVEERERLADELVTLARRRPHDFFRRGNGDEERYYVLARVVKAITGEQQWENSPYLALDRVLAEAISRLPTSMSGRQPEDLFRDRPPERVRHNSYEGSPEQEMAYVLYGYREDKVPQTIHADGSKAKKTYNHDYLPAALQLAYGSTESDTTRKRIVHIIRQDLADVLLDMEREAVARRDAPKGKAIPTTASNAYVTREGLERALSDGVAAYGTSGGLILLYGAGGMGKSRLAEEFVRGADHAVIKLGDQEAIDDSILDALEAFAAGNGTETGSPKRRLKKLLASKHGPKYMVLDDVSDPITWSQLLPEELPHTIVIATARRNILPARSGVAIKVDAMEADEACALILQQHPSLTQQHSEQLNHVLRGHALALTQATAFLRKYPMISADEFRNSLQSHTGEVVAGLPVKPTDAKLPAIYSQMLESLADSRSRPILRAAVFMPSPTLRHFLEAVSDVKSRLSTEYPDVAAARTDQAISELTELCLIDCQDEYVTMHPLAMIMFRHLLHDEMEEAKNDIRPVISTMLDGVVELNRIVMGSIYDD